MRSRIAEKLLVLLRIASAGASAWLHVESVLPLCLARPVSPSYLNETPEHQNAAECLAYPAADAEFLARLLHAGVKVLPYPLPTSAKFLPYP